MAEQMLFPKTWEEFEKQYGFHDSKQAYMYGNTRLIPSFRVQQWLDHIDDINHKKQSQKNKMEQVAAMFGKRLGEEFRVKSCHPEGNCVGCFTKYGFEGQNQTVTANVAVFLLLLTGKAVIVDAETD